MLSAGFAKMCFITAVLQALQGWNLVLSSSVYVGRHEAGKISEQGASTVSEVQTQCVDLPLCQRIIHVFGARNDVCNTQDKNLQDAVKKYCQATCGFCTVDCKDQFPDLCKEYGHFCNEGGDAGALVKEICPKTCNACHMRPSTEENNLVVISG